MSLLITTICDRNYRDYIPLFIHCVRKAYPEYGVMVYYRWEMDDYLNNYDIGTFITPCFKMEYPCNKGSTAMMRFAIEDPYILGYDNILITDIDMMILREKVGIEEQHLGVMKNTGLCYENLAIPHFKYTYRMPGVHFASKEWYERTKEARVKLLAYLIEPTSATSKDSDEYQLYKLCQPLGVSYKGHENWRWHGLHLGKYANRNVRGRRIMKDSEERRKIYKILEDKELCELFKLASEGNIEIKQIYNRLIDIVNNR